MEAPSRDHKLELLLRVRLPGEIAPVPWLERVERATEASVAFWHRFVEVAEGVRTIWTRDRDFRKFRGITVRDPFDPTSRTR